MTDSLANDLAYLEGQVSAALRHDAGKKIKCKQGYVQRGSACQKAKGEKDNALAKNLGTGLGAAILVGGAAAIAARGTRQQPTKTSPPPIAKLAETKKQEKPPSLAKKYLKAGASTAVAVTGAVIAQKQRQYMSMAANKAVSMAANRTVSVVANLLLKKEKKTSVGQEKDTLPQVIIKRRIKDLNDPNYREKATKVLSALAKNPEVADAMAVFVAPKFSGETNLVEAKKKASKVIAREVITNPEAREAALKYGSAVATEWGKDPEIRRVAGEYISKTVSGGKEESSLSPFQKILRRAERDTILLGTALSLATKKGGLSNFRENVKAKAGEKISEINSRRDSSEEDIDIEIFNSFYDLYSDRTTLKIGAGGKVNTPRVDTSDRRNDHAYLEGRMSVSLRYDRGRKLKCKEGYIQRGNACQKTGDKKPSDNLARNIGAGLGAAALVGGAAAIASRRSTAAPDKPSPLLPQEKAIAPPSSQKKETPVDKAVKLLSDKRTRKAAIAVGTTAAVVAGVVGIGNTKISKEHMISDVALIMTYKQSLALGGVADRALDRSDLSPAFKNKAKDLIGMTKLALARKALTVRGRDLIDIDKESNSFTYRDKKNGGIYTVASVGPALFSFQTMYKKEATGGPVYEVSFGINESNNKEESANLGASGAKQIIKLTKKAFDKHVEAMPDNSILTAGAYDKDGAGSKRKSIYEKVGFAPMEGQDPMVLYASKKDEKLGPLSNVYKPTQKPNSANKN